MEQIKTIKCIFQLPRDLGDQTFQRSSRCPAIITMTPPLLPPMHHVQQGGRPQLYEDLGDAEQLIQSPSEPWPSGLPAPWLGEGIYQLPLDNNLEWVQQQQQQQLQRQQQQQQQRQNLLRFSSSSANSDDATKRSCRRPDDVAPKRRNETASSSSKGVTKSGRKKKKSDVDSNKIVRPTTLIGSDEIEHLQQPIYMEVEDSGYTEDSSSTPSSGNNTNNMVSNCKVLKDTSSDSDKTSLTIVKAANIQVEKWKWKWEREKKKNIFKPFFHFYRMITVTCVYLSMSRRISCYCIWNYCKLGPIL